MEFSKRDVTIAKSLLGLAAVITVLGGFGVAMTVLWLACVVMFSIFAAALWKGVGTKWRLLRSLVHHGSKNGLTATEVYMRGRTVTAGMIFFIPSLYFLVR